MMDRYRYVQARLIRVCSISPLAFEVHCWCKENVGFLMIGKDWI